MPRPCKECPFNPAFEARYPSENVVIWIGKVMESEGQICHLTDERECEGARRFMEGEEGVFPSLIELAQARGRDDLASQFVTEMLRLMGATP